MSSICLIPARLKSTRFPEKLLAKVQGKTILQRTWERAKTASLFSEVYVATDHEKIARHVEEIGGQVLWTSEECQTGTERIIEALKKYPELKKAEIIVNVQADHPCTSPQAIEATVELLRKDQKASMATAAIRLTDEKLFFSPHVVKCVLDQNQNALYFSRSPIPYSRGPVPKEAYHHVGLYAYRTSFLLSSISSSKTPLQQQEDLEQLQVLEKGFIIKVALIEDPPIGIDTPEDLSTFEKYLKDHLNPSSATSFQI